MTRIPCEVDVQMEGTFVICTCGMYRATVTLISDDITSSSINVPTGRPLISRILSPTWMAFRTSGLMSIPLTLGGTQHHGVSVRTMNHSESTLTMRLMLGRERTHPFNQTSSNIRGLRTHMLTRFNKGIIILT